MESRTPSVNKVLTLAAAVAASFPVGGSAVEIPRSRMNYAPPPRDPLLSNRRSRWEKRRLEHLRNRRATWGLCAWKRR